MGTTKVFYGAVMVMFVCLLDFSCKGAERNVATDNDTVVLAQSEQSFTIDTSKIFYQTKVMATGKKVTGDKKILLLLDDPAIAQNSDGVYEIYVCPEKCEVNILSSSHPGFVNVVDLYALTVSDPPDYLSVDITRKTSEWIKVGQPFPSIYITVLFRGNRLPEKIESRQAGQMVVAGMRVVQKK